MRTKSMYFKPGSYFRFELDIVVKIKLNFLFIDS
jgi:hypothetical protein